MGTVKNGGSREARVQRACGPTAPGTAMIAANVTGTMGPRERRQVLYGFQWATERDKSNNNSCYSDVSMSYGVQWSVAPSLGRPREERG